MPSPLSAWVFLLPERHGGLVNERTRTTEPSAHCPAGLAADDCPRGSALHIIAICQISDSCRGQEYHLCKITDGKTPVEARRALKLRLSNVVYRIMKRDQRSQLPLLPFDTRRRFQLGRETRSCQSRGPGTPLRGHQKGNGKGAPAWHLQLPRPGREQATAPAHPRGITNVSEIMGDSKLAGACVPLGVRPLCVGWDCVASALGRTTGVCFARTPWGMCMIDCQDVRVMGWRRRIASLPSVVG